MRLIVVCLASALICGCGNETKPPASPGGNAPSETAPASPEPKPDTPAAPVLEPIDVLGGTLRRQWVSERHLKVHSLYLAEIRYLEEDLAKLDQASPDRVAKSRSVADQRRLLALSYERRARELDHDDHETAVRAKLHKSRGEMQRNALQAWASAAASYGEVRKQYPDYCQRPDQAEGDRGCADEVQFFEAVTAELSGNAKGALALYEAVAKLEKSHFADEARFAAADLRGREALSNEAELPTAKAALEAALQEAGDSLPGAFLHLRLALVHARKKDGTAARKHLEAAKAYCDAHPKDALSPALTKLVDEELGALGGA